MKKTLRMHLALLITLLLALPLLPAAWGETYSSTCKACGHVNTFTEDQVRNEVLYCSSCGALTSVEKTAASADVQGGWEYVGMEIVHIPPDWSSGGDPSGGTMTHSVDYQEGYAVISSESQGSSYYAKGEGASGRITWSSPPKRTLKPGEKVTIDLKAELIRHDNYDFQTICFGIVEYIGSSGSKLYLSAKGPLFGYGYDDKTIVSATNITGRDTANAVWFTTNDTGAPGDYFTIRVRAQGAGVNYEAVQCDYRYAWTGTSGVTDAGVDGGEEPSGLIPQIIDSVAVDATGDMTPVAVKTAVVIGAVSTLAAAAAAAAASGPAGASAAAEKPLSRKEQEEALNKKDQYRMVVNKTFGSTIENGRQDQLLFARMEQLQPDGGWLHVPGMDGQVTIHVLTAVEGLQLTSAPSSGKGAGCRVSLNNPAPPAEAVIAFKYQGPDTFFQNNITFKLGGEPEIMVPDHFCILGTVTEAHEVPYSVTGLPGQPEISLVYKSDLFTLALGKSQQGKTVIVAHATEKAGQMRFQRFVHRYPCELVVKTDTVTLREKFQVHLCYEGIGTAFKGTKNCETPEPIVLNCFPESEKDKRIQEAYRLPLAVMRWNPSAKKLEPDTAAVSRLQLEFTVDTRSKALSVAEAVKVLEASAILAEAESGPIPLELDMDKGPAVYRLYPQGAPEAGAPEIHLLLTVSDPDNLLEPFSLSAQLKPQVDFRGMIQWFLNYPRGTAVSQFIDLGSNDEYLSALAHIENRVYHRDHIPLNDNTIIIHRADGNYYEHGKGDIMRKPFIALVSVPKQVGDYDDIRSLYHELTHTLEDIRLDQRDGKVIDGAERRAYFLQFMADVAFHLADLERTGNTLRLGSAMTAMSNAFYVEEVIGAATIRQDAESFGAKCTLTSHELFEYYATAYNGPQAEAVRDAVLRLYFPGNVTKAEGVQIINKNDSVFVEEDGCFKGGKWMFRWSAGQLSRVAFEHPDYTAEVSERRWLPEKGLAMSMVVVLEDRKSKRKDRLQVVMDAGWISPKRIFFTRVKDFQTTWRTEVHTSEGILFSLTRGITEVVSMTRWVP